MRHYFNTQIAIERDTLGGSESDATLGLDVNDFVAMPEVSAAQSPLTVEVSPVFSEASHDHESKSAWT